MAPTKPKAGKAGASKTSSRKNTTKPSKSSSSSKVTKSKPKSGVSPKPHKPSQNNNPAKKKKRVYTEEELGIPKLNMITPAGVQKAKGKKKGKVFVDDTASMMTILAMVNADKEGQIESKMMKSRQMEEIREARQKEMEAKQQEKKNKLEETKKALRRKKPRSADEEDLEDAPKLASDKKSKTGKKRVSFA